MDEGTRIPDLHVSPTQLDYIALSPGCRGNPSNFFLPLILRMPEGLDSLTDPGISEHLSESQRNQEKVPNQPALDILVTKEVDLKSLQRLFVRNQNKKLLLQHNGAILLQTFSKALYGSPPSSLENKISSKIAKGR